MPEGNPLVAAPVETTTAVTGIGIAESATDLANGLSSGSWVEAGLGAGGVGLEVLSMVIDPAGTLASYGVGWLIEHIQPLKEALDWLAGDPPEIRAFSETWANVSAEVAAVSQEYLAEAGAGTGGWTGAAADGYRGHAAEAADAIAGAAALAGGISTGVAIMGEVVAAVRELVREIVASLVGRLITWALELAATLGLATPLVVSQAVSAISKTVNDIATFIRKLVKTIGNVTPLIRNVTTKLDEITAKLTGLMRGADGPGTPTGTSAAGRSAADVPTTSTPGGTTPSSATDTPGGTRTDVPQTTRTDGRTPAGTDAPATTPAGTRTDPVTPAGTGRSPSRPDNPGQTATDVDGRRCVNDPIDVATGEMVLHQTDVALPGVLPLVLTRTHVSSYRAGRGFGRSWSATIDQRLEIDADGVVFVADQGMLLVYPHAGESPVLPREGPRWPLRRLPDGGHVIEQPELGRSLRFAGSHGGLVEIADRNGNRIDFLRDGDGVAAEVRHTGGYTVAVDRVGEHVVGLRLLGRVGGSDVVLMRYHYDDAGRLAEVVNSSGGALRFDNDPAGRIVRWEDRNGQWYGYTYDDLGRCVRNEGAGGFLAGTFTYRDRLTVFTDALGGETWFHLDESGRIVREVDPVGNASTTEWDRHDRPLVRTDPLGSTTRHTYDTDGNLVELVRADGSTLSAGYDDPGLPTRITDPTGGVWLREYDERGNLVSVTDPVGAVTRYEHGGLASVTDPLGNTSTLTSNAAGLAVSVTDPLGATTRYTRDVLGRITAVLDAVGGTTRLTWSIEGELLARTMPDGATEHWRYDGEGNLVEHVDAVGGVTRTSYTGFDLPAARTGQDGTRLEFAYDALLRLVSVTNSRGAVWRYEYDPAGNLVAETDFNGTRLRYRHDAAGRLVERVNGMGESVTYTRDAMGAVTEKRVGDAVTTFAYDPAGLLTRAVSPDATLELDRDPVGRVLAESVDGRRVESAYDEAGRRTRRVTPSGAESVWEHDANGRPVVLRTGGQTVRFGYDDAGREVQRALGGAVLAQTWDTNHRLASQAVTGMDRSPANRVRVVQRRRYSYRPDGRLVGVDDDLAGSRRLELDPAGRVTAVHGANWTERYAYDDTGNVTAATWPSAAGTPDGEEQGTREHAGSLVRRAGNTHYEHDAQGRMLVRSRRTLSGQTMAWRYTWDAEDRLVAVRTPDGVRWRYGYDALGRRVAKERLGEDGTVVERTDFTWDGVTLAEQSVSRSGATPSARVTSWDWAQDEFRPITQTERASAADAGQEWVDERFYALVTDLVGTPTEMVDTDGELAWRNRTTLWGVALAQPGGRAYCPLRFPGQYFDHETGHHYNYHRYYDPHRGAFDSPDPVGLVGGANPHGYVANPTTTIDPLGLTPCTPTRREAFRQARRDLGIPHHQQPDAVNRVPLTDRNGRQIFDENHRPVMTREYHYTRSDGSQVVIQDHAAGHQFGEGGVGDQGPHFNVRPAENTRNGHVPGTQEHYPFG